MARHNMFTLDPHTASHAATMRGLLAVAQEAGAEVTLTVRKRDDAPGVWQTRTGTVEGFSGAAGMSTDAVLLNTAEGFRTFNTWLIREVAQ